MKCCDKDAEQLNDELKTNTRGLICYCFKYSKDEFYKAIQNGSEQEIVDDIKVKMKDPGCFCETANPSGKCCLLDISSFIKQFKKGKT